MYIFEGSDSETKGVSSSSAGKVSVPSPICKLLTILVRIRLIKYVCMYVCSFLALDLKQTVVLRLEGMYVCNQ